MAKHKPAQDEKGRFITGNSGGGRPKGSRNQLGEAFIADIYADWQKHGIETISRVREERPQDYLKVVASILPKDINLSGAVQVSKIERVIVHSENTNSGELDAEIARLDREAEELRRGSGTEH